MLHFKVIEKFGRELVKTINSYMSITITMFTMNAFVRWKE